MKGAPFIREEERKVPSPCTWDKKGKKESWKKAERKGEEEI
jgi:hypothetical protein